MRLIDVDYAKKSIRKECQKCIQNGNDFCKKVCVVNKFCELIDIIPTANGIINAQDFRARIHNHQYVYLQDCAQDVLDAIDCEVTYFKEKQNNGKK